MTRAGESGGGESLFPYRVWKFAVSAPDSDSRSFIDVQRGTQIISVGVQNDKMVAWGLVPSGGASGDTERHVLIVANTGPTIPFPPDSPFLGTVITSNGIVWHVWDGGTRAA